MILQCLTLLGAYNEKVPNVLLLVLPGRKLYQWIVYFRQVDLRNLATMCCLSVQIAELDTQHGSLNFVQTAIHSLVEVLVLLVRTIVT
ncbi:hypothetical protein D9M68_867450 [compost metagenome]